MVFNFPRIKFVNNGAIIKQLIHLGSEVTEANDAALAPDTYHTAIEIMDALHSAESALRIMEEFHGIDLADVRDHVEAKNRARNYYDIN